MKRNILTLIFIFIISINALALTTTKKECTARIDGLPSLASIETTCNQIIKSEICKSVEKKKIRNCSEKSNIAESSWDFIKGCANGAFDSVKSIIDFVYDLMKGVWATVTGEVDLKEKKDSALKYVDSLDLYLKTEYYKSYREESEPFREFKAINNLSSNIAQMIVRKISEYLSRESEIYTNCYNLEAKTHKVCEFMTDLFFPPGGAIAFLKYGVKASTKVSKINPGKGLKLTEIKIRKTQINSKTELDQNFMHYSPTTAKENDEWINRAKNAGKVRGTFFEIENQALKRLNDTLGDKNLVTSLTNFHKEIFLSKLDLFQSKYPHLNFKMYSDFKSIRLSFGSELSPDEISFLTKITEMANNEFSQKTMAMDLGTKIKNENIAGWFSSGVGNTADQAGLAARESRTKTRGDGSLPTLSFKEMKKDLLVRTQYLEKMRGDLYSLLSKSPSGKGLFTFLLPSNTPVLSREVFEALRKGDKEAFKILKQKFGVELSSEEKILLLQYYKGIDKLSPGIWVSERVVANLDAADLGGFSADFAGMGAANIERVAQDLALFKGDDVDDLISKIRKGEEEVTKEFNSKKAFFLEQTNSSLSKFGDRPEIKCSGDDCVSIVRQTLNVKKKKEIISDFASKSNPSGMRISFIPPGIQKDLRTKIAVTGELIEKDLRKKITGVGNTLIPNEKMKNVMIALDMPKGVKGDQVNLYIGIKGNSLLTEKELEIIRTQFKEVMKDMQGNVDYGNGIRPSYASGDIFFIKTK